MLNDLTYAKCLGQCLGNGRCYIRSFWPRHSNQEKRGSVRDFSNSVGRNGGDILEKENLLAFLKSFQAGECLFCILPLCKQEGLGHLYQVHQPSGVYYKHEAHGNQICPGEEDAPAD